MARIRVQSLRRRCLLERDLIKTELLGSGTCINLFGGDPQPFFISQIAEIRIIQSYGSTLKKFPIYKLVPQSVPLKRFEIEDSSLLLLLCL